MRPTSGGSSNELEMQDSSAHEDKFFVSVRLRPLSEKELIKNDVADWECINNTTVVFKNSALSMLPTAYTFDRVFGPKIPTRQVYVEAAKRTALSVLSGLNSSIFAYGQTSSGKTYTMSGITEYAVTDIYDYMKNHPERVYMVKFSALEIYNEIVKDLLGSDTTPRRLQDDPVRGTVVEKLTEVEVRDFSHLKRLLSFCQAQRTVGETALNEVSSRSHQILCLTVASEPLRRFSTDDASMLMASVNFVDLAGSERSSQTAAAGARLKEGSHINRSLLTLGTVIRKLSKGRSGHVPFRNSKLTRILQNSLGGNARTAIICTMSPAHSHVEQSKSTLVFANCAKRISTHAQVNVITPEKALVKQLRREIARLENEVRTLSALAASSDSTSTLKEKELVEKLTNEIRQLTHQHDLIQPHGEDILHHRSTSMTDFRNHEKGSWTDICSASEASEIVNPFHSDVSSRTSPFIEKCKTASSCLIEDQYPMIFGDQFLSDNTSPRLYIDKYFGTEAPPDPGWENFMSGNEFEGLSDKLQGIEFDFTKRNIVPSIPSTQKEDKDSGKSSMCPSNQDVSGSSVNASGYESCSEVVKENEEISQNDAQDVYDTSVNASGNESCSGVVKENEERSQNDAQDVSDPSVYASGCESCSEGVKENEEISQNDAQDISDPSVNASGYESCSEVVKENEEISQNDAQTEPEASDVEPEGNSEHLQTEGSHSPEGADCKNEKEENIETFNKDSKVEQQESCMEVKPETNNDNLQTEAACGSMRIDYKNEKAVVIKRFKQSFKIKQPDPGVEEFKKVILRNLANQFEDDSPGENHSPDQAMVVVNGAFDCRERAADERADKDQDTGSNSLWYAKFEKQKQEIIELWAACNVPLVYRTYFFLLFKGDPSDTVYMEVELRRLSFLKNKLYETTAVDDQFFTEATSAKALNREREWLSRQMLKNFSGKERKALYQKWGISTKSKQRRLQLCRMLWTDTTNMEHVKESAAIVAKLVGFKDTGNGLKETIGLSFLPKPDSHRSSSWKRRTHSLTSLIF